MCVRARVSKTKARSELTLKGASQTGWDMPYGDTRRGRKREWGVSLYPAPDGWELGSTWNPSREAAACPLVPQNSSLLPPGPAQVSPSVDGERAPRLPWLSTNTSRSGAPPARPGRILSLPENGSCSRFAEGLQNADSRSCPEGFSRPPGWGQGKVAWQLLGRQGPPRPAPRPRQTPDLPRPTEPSPRGPAGTCALPHPWKPHLNSPARSPPPPRPRESRRPRDWGQRAWPSSCPAPDPPGTFDGREPACHYPAPEGQPPAHRSPRCAGEPWPFCSPLWLRAPDRGGGQGVGGGGAQASPKPRFYGWRGAWLSLLFSSGWRNGQK